MDILLSGKTYLLGGNDCDSRRARMSKERKCEGSGSKSEGESCMFALECARVWLADRLDRGEEGQTATEYVLVILGVVLFLVFAAFALNGILGSATNAIQNWINQVAPPPAP
jgi:hypothetical protein